MLDTPIQRDAATADFLDGTARGEFLLVRDTRTGEILHPQFDATVDPDRYVRFPAAGTGTVVSFSVVHHRTPDGDIDRIPVGIVELDEGPWWWTAITGAEEGADLMGRRVQVAYRPAGEETVPYFAVT